MSLRVKSRGESEANPEQDFEGDFAPGLTINCIFRVNIFYRRILVDKYLSVVHSQWQANGYYHIVKRV